MTLHKKVGGGKIHMCYFSQKMLIFWKYWCTLLKTHRMYFRIFFFVGGKNFDFDLNFDFF